MKPLATLRRPRAALVAVMALATLLLTGCMKMQADFNIKIDDTYDATVYWGYDEAAVSQLAGMTGMSVDDMLDQMDFDAQLEELQNQFGSDATAEPWSDGTYKGQKLTINNQPLSDLAGSAVADDLSIIRDGNTYTLDGVLDMSGDEFDLSSLDALGMSGMEPVVIMSFTFPGPVISSTGQVSGNTVTFTPKLGEVNRFSAEATTGGAVPPPTPPPTPDPTPEPDPDPDPDPTDEPEPSLTPEPRAPIDIEPVDEPLKATDEAESGKSNTLWFIVLGAGLLALLGAGGGIFMANKSKKKQAGVAPGYAPPGAAGYQSAMPPAQQYAPPAQQSFAPPPAAEAPTQQMPPAQPYVPPAAEAPLPPEQPGQGYPPSVPPTV